LLTYNQHPKEKIRKYENNEKVDKFDEYDTFDSRGLLYDEESIRETPLFVKKEEKWVHTPMPFYLYQDNKAFSGQYRQKNVDEPKKKGRNDEELQSTYIYVNKPKPKPKEIAKVIAAPETVVKEKREFTHTAMPFFLYNDDIVSKGKYTQPEVKQARKQAVVGEEINLDFIYCKKKKPVEVARPVVVKKKEEEEWTHAPMPMFMYYEDTMYKGKETMNIQQEPKKAPKRSDETLQPLYIYKMEREEKPVFLEPESSKKIVPIVVKKTVDKKLDDSESRGVKMDKENDKPIKLDKRFIDAFKPLEMEDVDMPSAMLPHPPNIKKKFEPSQTKEDLPPVILMPTTLKELSPEKKRDSPVKKTHNLMKSYKDQTHDIEKSKLTKMDELDDHNDMFVPMEPYHSNPKECLCAMCVKNKSRIKRPKRVKKRENPHLPMNDSDLETHQKNKLESRIHRLPKLNKPKKINDPYKNRNKDRRNRPKVERPFIKPDFSVSFTKFLKKNIETKEIKQKNPNTKNDDYLESLEDGAFKGKSKTSLDKGDNLDRYFDNERRR
jgi:hypothetical protein